MKVLMSIKPKYADKIFDGTKTVELRKKIWSNPDVRDVVVYVSHPVKKVIGEFSIRDIDRVSVLSNYEKSAVWSIIKGKCGITSYEFVNYFFCSSDAYLIWVTGAMLYDIPKPLSDYSISRPPQNFMYLED